MIHPNTELRYINENVGHGIVATRDIPKGTITWVQDKLDREFSPDQIVSFGTLFEETLDKYCFRNQQGNWILCWDHARFVNHSFKSNCMTTAYNFEIAVRDIHEGEELTDDYGYLNIMHPFRALDEGLGRDMVYPDDLIRHHTAWDAQLNEVWPSIVRNDQQLRSLLSDKIWNHINRITTGEEKMASILECYYEEDPSRSFR